MKSTKALNDALNRLHATRQAKAAERLAKQPELFDTGSDTPLSSDELATTPAMAADTLPASSSADVEIDAANAKRERSKLLPVRHVERDFFLCDMFDYAMKDDGVSMEAPIFTLSTKPDLNIWHWKSKDGNKTLTVTPSVKGRATQHDKDVLIFIVSQMTEAINCGRQDAKNKVVRFVVYDFLITTNKTTSGNEYYRLSEAFERLRGTSITTDIRTGGTRVREGFGLIDKWKIIEKSPDDERMIAVEVTMSDWLFNAVQAQEVLTIHRNYFRLRKPLERRLYELARKHCGKQASWSIGLELLREKCGAHSHIRSFRSQAIGIASTDVLPEYRMLYNRENDQVTFYIRDAKKLLAAVASGKSKLAINAKRPEKVKLGGNKDFSCKNSSHLHCFRTLILATVLAALSSHTSIHRNRSRKSAKSRLFALTNQRKRQFDLFGALGINSHVAADTA